MKINKIFVVDDESIVRVTLSDDLKDLGYEVFSYDNPLLALIDIPNIEPNLIITDIKMPEMSGIEFLKEVKKNHKDIYVIIMTGYGSVDSAVEAVKSGAYDYLNKPLNIEDIKIILEQIENLEGIRQDFDTIINQFTENYNYDTIIGSSNSTKKVIESIKKVAPTSTTVLIKGETGTGKELIANVIHYNSLRKSKPFIKLSCATLSREIFESELFGHIKGAFTGAIKDKKGRFELADKGTLYLDDIDDIPLDLQVKLLRVLELGEFEKVGGEKKLKVDVRIIASTKKDLKKLVEEGKFRDDLYYRLNVFPIELQPLRERPEDIKDIFLYFLEQYLPKNSIQIDDEVFEILKNYQWFGNVRELKHLVERISIISDGFHIRTTDLPYELLNLKSILIPYKPDEYSLDEFLYNIERNILVQTLARTSGNKTKAAEILKLPYSTLRSKLEKFKLSDEEKN